MRADRLLSLLLLLRSPGRMSAPALAAELEVSTRTVLRDIEALSAAGIPVYAERGRAGGFALLPGFSTDLTGLTPDEAVALLTSPGPRAPAEALGLRSAFSSAMRKVRRGDAGAVPGARRRAPPSGCTCRGAAGSCASRRRSSALEVVQRAVFAGRRLRIRYASGERPERRPPSRAGAPSTRSAWSRRRAGGTCWAPTPARDRTYRVSRIAEAEELAEPAARPDGVDLAALWERRRVEFLAGLPGTETVFRVPDAMADEVTAAVSALSVEPDGTGRTVVRARFGGVAHAVRVLWAMAPDAEALDPPELRAALRARATAFADRHA